MMLGATYVHLPSLNGLITLYTLKSKKQTPVIDALQGSGNFKSYV
jgi:hypothetical protein